MELLYNQKHAVLKKNSIEKIVFKSIYETSYENIRS